MSNLKNKFKLAKESFKTIAENVIERKELTVSEEEYQKRQAICSACEKHDKCLNKCNECGCFLSVKGRLAGMKCPLGKW